MSRFGAHILFAGVPRGHEYMRRPGARRANNEAKTRGWPVRRSAVAALSVIASLLAAGCAQSTPMILVPATVPLVWPKAPEPPRVRLLGEIPAAPSARREQTIGEFWNGVFFGMPPPKRMTNPYAVAVHADGNRVAVADVNGACVHLFDLARQTHSWRDRCGPGQEAFACPVGVTWAGETLCVADSRRHAVALMEGGGGGRWIGREALKRPAGLAHCARNDLLYVTDAGAHAVVALDRAGRVAMRFGTRGAGPGQFSLPAQVACGAGDEIAVADSLNARIQRFGLDGSPIGAFGRKGDAAGDFSLPKGVAYDPEGRIWVVDAQFENVQGFAANGQLLLAFGQEGQRPGEFWLPAGICIDARRRMWVADSYNRRVQVFELVPS